MGAANSSKFILPEEILDFQRCTECKNYLSCPPTEVHCSGKVTCGRCAKLVHQTGKGTISTYEKIAQQTLFLCINRFEGCTELLEYDKVSSHEEKCKGNSYQCPTCSLLSNQPRSLLYLINHYKIHHPNLVLTEPVILVQAYGCKRYMYCKQGQFFIIQAIKNIGGLNVQVYTTLKNCQVKVKMTIAEQDGHQIYESEKMCSIFKGRCPRIATHLFQWTQMPDDRTILCRFNFKIPEMITQFKN